MNRRRFIGKSLFAAAACTILPLASIGSINSLSRGVFNNKVFTNQRILTTNCQYTNCSFYGCTFEKANKNFVMSNCLLVACKGGLAWEYNKTNIVTYNIIHGA